MNRAMLSARPRCETRKIQVRRAVTLTLALGLAGALGCRSRPTETPAPSKPVYSAEEATVFNDFFRPELFGLQGAETAPEDDRLLPDRVARADVVVAGRVVTLTREADARGGTYSVVVAPVASPLVGRPSDTPLVLTIPAKSTAYAWIDSHRDACVGIRTLVFAREYEDGVHFHASLDTPAVRDAVIRAKLSQAGPR